VLKTDSELLTLMWNWCWCWF